MTVEIITLYINELDLYFKSSVLNYAHNIVTHLYNVMYGISCFVVYVIAIPYYDLSLRSL